MQLTLMMLLFATHAGAEPEPDFVPVDAVIPMCVPAGVTGMRVAPEGLSLIWRSPVVPLSVAAASLLEAATSRSSIISGLVRRLEKTDVVVYLTDLRPGDLIGPMSYMAFLTRDSTHRYILVRIDHRRLKPSERIALLGHELQHALEVAGAPEVGDAASMARMYRRIGWGVDNRFETATAREVGDLVRKQLIHGKP